MQEGDLIIALDDAPVADLSSAEFDHQVCGDVASLVSLLVVRDDAVPLAQTSDFSDYCSLPNDLSF